VHSPAHLLGKRLHGNRPAVFQGRASRIYDVMARRLLRGVYRRLADDIADAAPEDAEVLDVGTGPGVLLVEIARRRPDLRLVGIDLSADMVAAAERNLSEFGARASARLGDVTDLPFPDRSFDLIVSSFSLHHWDDPEAAVPELERVLRPGGRLCIYDFRHAPFDAVVTAARAASLFTGQPPQRTLLRTGVPLFPRCVKHVMSSASR
jgi:ubiquinone/menaquinone biosynthesis C-methylase UbiE